MSNNCKTCRAPIPAKAAALSCIFCSGIYHIKCVNITKNQFDAINSVPGGVWKCTGCADKGSEDIVTQTSNTMLLKAIEDLQKAVSMLQNDIKALKSEKNLDTCSTELVINEIAERQKRERNIVIYKLEDNNDDINRVTEIIKRVAPNVKTENLKAFRLGRAENNRPSPLKVQLSSREDVYLILKNKSKLKQYNINITISTDQTKMQQEYFKKTLNELNSRKAEGECNIFIKYVNGIPTIARSKNA